MKTNQLKIILCFAVVLLLGVCTDDEPKRVPRVLPEMSVSLKATAIEFSDDGQIVTVTGAPSGSATPVGHVLTTNGSIVFTMTTNQSTWDASVSGGSWLRINKSDKTFTLTADRNETSSARSASISLIAGEAPRLTVAVSQKAMGSNQNLPRVATAEITDVAARSAVMGGVISHAGTPPYTERGVWWGTTQNTEQGERLAISGSGTGPFIATINQLEPNTTYYVQAYAINTEGKGVGEMLSFTTLDETKPAAPTNLTATAVSSRQINLSWTNPPNTTHCSIDCLLDGETEWGIYVGYTPDISSWEFDNCPPGTTHYYRVYAWIAGVNEHSDYSNIAHATTNNINENPPVLTTADAKDITINSATLGGNIIYEGSPAYTERGVCISLNPNPKAYDNTRFIDSGSGTGAFTVHASGLHYNTIHYARAYAIHDEGIEYGNEISFTTLSESTNPPAAPANLTATAVSASQINLNWNSVADAHGYKVERSPNGMSEWTEIEGAVIGTTYQNTGLSAGTTYHYRVRAYNASGNSEYSNTTYAATYTTSVNPPVLTTAEAKDVTTNSATLGGNITYEGSPAYTDRGVCISVSPNPNVYDNLRFIVSGGGTGAFTVQASGLSANTTFYARAYASHDGGTEYGNEISFKTLSESGGTVPAAPANLTATAVSAAQINLNWNSVTDANGYKVERSPNGTSEWTEIEGAITGTTYQNTALPAGTTYHYRVRAFNANGNSGYSNTANATTHTASGSLPALTTNSVTTFTSTTATLGGNISNSGNPAYTERGVVYATTQNPTTANNKTIVTGSGTGSFSTNVSGLSANATYYVRAYATNDTGTAYGDQVSFTTSAANALPELSTNAASNIAQTTATLGGNISNAGTPAYSERGVCWSTSQNPTTSGSKVTSTGSGTGSFSVNVSGLTANTMYYARAYAINEAGTAYGAQVSFTTLAAIPATPTGLTATTISASQINLSWSSVSGATGYHVERATNANGPWTVLTSSHTTTTYQSTGLSAGSTYYYRVRAYNAGGNSGYSTVVNARTWYAAPVLSGPSSATTNIILTWTIQWDILNTDRFVLEASVNNSAWDVIDNDISPSLRSIGVDVGTQLAGATVRFRMRIRNSGGVPQSDYSGIVTVQIANTPAPITVGPTRSNALIYNSLENNQSPQAQSNTAFPMAWPLVGNNYFENLVGYSLLAYRTALYYNVNSQIQGKTIKKAEIRMNVNQLPGTFTGSYNIEAIASSWSASLTYNQSSSLSIYNGSLITKAPPTTGALPWVIDVTTYVQNWANGTWTNNGIILYDVTPYPGFTAFRGSEFSSVDLYIEFQ